MTATQLHEPQLQSIIDDFSRSLRETAQAVKPRLHTAEVGTVSSVGTGFVRAAGLPGVKSEEMVIIGNHVRGVALNLEPDSVAIVLLDRAEDVEAGDEVRRTHEIMSVPVGDAVIGRVVDATGKPLDEKGPVQSTDRLPLERPAPAIMDRAPVSTPLQTGIQVIDALIPIGRGQRELIIGDRQIGKTAIAVDTIINQKDKDVICIYCAIGKRTSAVAKVISDLEQYGAMDYTFVVVATGEDTPWLNFSTPYAAMSMGEYFMENGRDVLIVFDDLTRHAWAYREISLLLRRPPAREAYPGDIFYIHSRLLERSTHLIDDLGGGSLTALPIIETQAQNLSAYIPTNLISITDGQIYLSPQQFQEGFMPAVDVGKSVSRVGGKTQLPAYRSVAGDLRLSYSQFQELESFARFGTRLDEETKKTLQHGKRIREIFKQVQYAPIPVEEQIAVLLTVSQGLLDDWELDKFGSIRQALREAVSEQVPQVCDRIRNGEKLSDDDRQQLLDMARDVIDTHKGQANHAEDAGSQKEDR